MNEISQHNFLLKSLSLAFALIATVSFLWGNTHLFGNPGNWIFLSVISLGSFVFSLFLFLASFIFRQKTKVRAGIVFRK